MKSNMILAAVLLACVVWSLPSTSAPENVLLVILDDIGSGQVGTYGENPNAVATPTLDALADHGVLFRNAWSHTVCSATRAAMYTGQHAFRTGCGISVDWNGAYQLASSWDIIPELIDAETAIVGKWHVTNKTPPNAAYHKPVTWGFGTHLGAIKNIGVDNSFYLWERNVAIPDSATQALSEQYATTQNVDDALSFMEAAEAPWFLVVAFNAAHSPYEPPPPELHSVEPLDTPTQLYRAMIQAMDTELARLLMEVDLAETTVIVMGDNGEPGEVADGWVAPGHGKQTVYEGGVNVPLIVAGDWIQRPGRPCNVLVQDVDAFPTVLELFGVRPPSNDGISLVPYLENSQQTALREMVFTEVFDPNGDPPYDRHDWAIRDGRHKLISLDGKHEFYDLVTDPQETTDLLPLGLSQGQQNAYEALLDAQESIVDD